AVEQSALNVIAAHDRDVADLNEYVAGPESGLAGRRAAVDAIDEHAPRHAVAHLLDLIPAREAVDHRRAPPRAQHVIDDANHVVHGDGEADPLSARANGDVHAHQLALHVEERPARIAGVDARVGLDQRLVRHVLVQADVALDGADDAHADGMLVAIGVAN